MFPILKAKKKLHVSCDNDHTCVCQPMCSNDGNVFEIIDSFVSCLIVFIFILFILKHLEYIKYNCYLFPSLRLKKQ